MNDFRRALALLTVLPVRLPPQDNAVLGRAMAFYPLVGALLGMALAGLTALLRLAGPAPAAPLLVPALLLAAWAILTGALHLDGWADSCDALFVPVSRERRLEIMKDPRLGGFGAVGLVLLLLVKLAALQGVSAAGEGLVAVVLAPALARYAVVVAAYASPLAKPGGMAALFRQGLGRREVAAATGLTGLVLLAATPFLGWRPAVLVIVTAAVAWALARLTTARLGGLTGDVYGAVIESVETAVLVTACFL